MHIQLLLGNDIMNNTQKKLISNFGIENNLAERISKQLTISKIKQYGKRDF